MDKASPPQFDLCILGCGPAGFAAAMRALDFGKKVCIIEADEVGGTGVKWGALASKTLWELAKDYSTASQQDRGYQAWDLKVEYGAVRATVLQAVKEKQAQILNQLAAARPDNWQGPGSVTMIKGWGRFVDKSRVEVERADGSKEVVSARYFLVATGTRPRAIPGFPPDQKQILDSDGVLNLKAFPKSMIIVGAGIIGCEYATIFASFGQTRVILIDHADHVLPYEDEDVSRFVENNLRRKGVEIIHSAKVRDLLRGGDHLKVMLDCQDGQDREVVAECLLVAIGRSFNRNNLGLEHLGIDVNRAGILKTDEHCRLQDNIYAAGDLTHHPALVNIAELEGRYAVKHMFDVPRWPLNYANMATVMFFNPPVAAVGLNEKQCRQKKIAYRVGYYSFALVNRAIAMRATNGFVKILVTADSEQRLLGMRAGGPQVSSMILSIGHLIDQGTGLEQVLKSVYPHPTVSEAIGECLRMLQGKSVFKAQSFPDQMWIRAWQPPEA